MNVLGIKIDQVDGSLAVIEWKFKLIHQRGRKTQTFTLLNCFHPSKYNIFCSYSSMYSGATVEGCYKYKVHLSLNQTKGQDDLEFQEKPISIFGSFTKEADQDNKFLLKELQCSDMLNVWKSEDIEIGAYNCPQPETKFTSKAQPLFVTCKIWLGFNNFTHDELIVLKNCIDLFLKQIDCDANFCFEDGQCIGAHTNVLVAKSPVFAAMFQHEMKESKTGRIAIKDIEADVFQQLLYFIYSGRTKTPLTEDNVQPLYVAADKYDVKDLRDNCILYMMYSIRVDNAMAIIIFAYSYSIEELKKAAIEFARFNTSEVSEQDNFADLIKNYPDFSVEVMRSLMKKSF